MKKSVFKILLGLVLSLFLGIQTVSAQVVDSKNKVEYMSEDTELNDLNSITSSSIKKTVGVPVKKVNRRVKKQENISMEDLQSISNLRYRKKRNDSEKCKKAAVKKCESLDEKKKRLAKMNK